MDQPHLSSRATRVEAATTPRCTRTQSFHSSPITVRIVIRTTPQRVSAGKLGTDLVRTLTRTLTITTTAMVDPANAHPDPRCRLWANRRVRFRPAQSVKDQVNPDRQASAGAGHSGEALRCRIWLLGVKRRPAGRRLRRLSSAGGNDGNRPGTPSTVTLSSLSTATPKRRTMATASPTRPLHRTTPDNSLLSSYRMLQ
jgi:hypothetical protein